MDETKEIWKNIPLIKEMQEALAEPEMDDWDKGYNACAHRVLVLLDKIEENYN